MKYKHFTKEDRIKLSALLKTGITKIQISEILNKNLTSIWREIKRNHKQEKYLSGFANKKSQIRKTHRNKKIENDLSIRKYILKDLKHYWSPEQITGRLRNKEIFS